MEPVSRIFQHRRACRNCRAKVPKAFSRCGKVGAPAGLSGKIILTHRVPVFSPKTLPPENLRRLPFSSASPPGRNIYFKN